MTLEQAKRHIVHWVRYRLPQRGCGHLSAARIIAVHNGKVEVKPRWHKHTEMMDPSGMRLWKSRNATLPVTTGP